MNDISCPLCRCIDCTCFYSFGNHPLVNTPSDADGKYPLDIYHCPDCGLAFVNTPRHPSEIFSEYSYFSSWSSQWLDHCKDLFTNLVGGYGLDPGSAILEIASNDGYMLSNFLGAGFHNITGVEPATNVAAAAAQKGIPTINEFFTLNLAQKMALSGKYACIIANNVLAHVPDIRDFLMGVAFLLEDDGFCVMEFHHLLSLIKLSQFDTVYHEHFSYLALKTVAFAMELSGLRIYDAMKIPTQGGSLRIFVSLKSAAGKRKYPLSASVEKLIREEIAFGLFESSVYASFRSKVDSLIHEARRFLLLLADNGRPVSGYGAAAKAVVFINAMGLSSTDICCVADRNPVKQGRPIPGTDIPVVSPASMLSASPDYIIVFPWNLKDEIINDLKPLAAEGTRFVVLAPCPEVIG